MIAAAHLPLRNEIAQSEFLPPGAHGRIWLCAH